jgi:signal transduction histidine kinase
MARSPAIDPFALDRCPVTGLSITHRPNWRDLELARGYSISFCVVGERVLVSAPRGNAGRAGVLRLFEERERVLREAGLWDKPHFEIMDFSAVATNHPRETRNQFSSSIAAEAHRGMLRGYWACNGPPLFRWIIRVAKLLAIAPRVATVAFVKDYREAILCATNAQAELEHRPGKGLRRDEWIVVLEGGHRFHFEIIGRDIVYAELPGELPVKYVERFFDLYGQVLSMPGFFPGGSHRLIVRLVGFRGGTWRGRQAYLAGMYRFCRRYGAPDHVVALGTTRMFYPVLNINRHLIPYYIESAASLPQAIEMMAQQRERGSTPWLVRVLRLGRLPSKIWSQREIDRHIEEILELFGSVNWETGGQGKTAAVISSSNPLGVIADAIRVLKQDFDTMLHEQAEMKTQVVRAAKLASLGTLTAGLAHELNNPLTAVLGFAQRLERVEDASVRENAVTMVRAARRMKVIVDKLLQADRRLLVAEQSLVDLNTSVNEGLLLFEQQLDRGAIAVDLQLQADLPRILGNVEHFEGVVHNLLANARDSFNSIDGERLKKITIATARDGRWVKLTFGDNGCGMAGHDVVRAFDPFYTTKDEGQGAGLGLYVAHKIVEQCDGSITLDSTPDEGTVVQILLPVSHG